MKTFKLEIQELLSRVVEIKAGSEVDAFLKIKEMYKKGEIILDSSDYIDTTIINLDNLGN